jgi:isopenicillin N synthase-like dioxygenase
MIARIEPLDIYGDLPIAQLPVIDFSKLLSGDDAEIVSLVDICKSLGFFNLNFNNDAGQPLLDNSRGAFQFMEEYFDQPLEVKLRDIRQSVTHG